MELKFKRELAKEEIEARKREEELKHAEKMAELRVREMEQLARNEKEKADREERNKSEDRFERILQLLMHRLEK